MIQLHTFAKVGMLKTHSIYRYCSPQICGPYLPHYMTKTCAHISLRVSTPLFPRSCSVLCFLASSGSSKQESSPNDGIKRVRKMTEKERKRMWQTAFCSPTPTVSKLRQKKKETARDGVPLVSSLCLFLAAALLPSVDQTPGVEGSGYCQEATSY